MSAKDLTQFASAALCAAACVLAMAPPLLAARHVGRNV
jgi:hypothetical protein